MTLRKNVSKKEEVTLNQNSTYTAVNFKLSRRQWKLSSCGTHNETDTRRWAKNERNGPSRESVAGDGDEEAREEATLSAIATQINWQVN